MVNHPFGKDGGYLLGLVSSLSGVFVWTPTTSSPLHWPASSLLFWPVTSRAAPSLFFIRQSMRVALPAAATKTPVFLLPSIVQSVRAALAWLRTSIPLVEF